MTPDDVQALLDRYVAAWAADEPGTWDARYGPFVVGGDRAARTIRDTGRHVSTRWFGPRGGRAIDLGEST